MIGVDDDRSRQFKALTPAQQRLGVKSLAGELRARYGAWVEAVVTAAASVCDQRLLGAVVYGSVGRGRPHEGSDIDLLLVIEPLEFGRRARADLAERIENAACRLAADLPDLSLVLRTPAEVRSGFPLLLDMVDDGRIVHDSAGVVAGLLEEWSTRLAASGARRVLTGEAWHWDLAPGASRGRWSL